MRSREAWLAAMAAVLGVSDGACKKDATDAPAAVREVTSASASATVAASAPSETASSEVAASASAPMASASVAPPQATGIGLGNIGTIGTIGHGACGVGRVNPACGASTTKVQEPRAVIATTVTGAASGDEHVIAAMRPRLRNCANKGLLSDPTETGKAVVTIAVGANGDVTSANVTTSTGLGGSTLACMASVFRTVTFGAGAPRSLLVTIVQRHEER